MAEREQAPIKYVPGSITYEKFSGSVENERG